MGEKTKVPFISDTVLINGVYQPEQRSGVERRRNRKKYPYYDRRRRVDPRIGKVKKISEQV
ncbi:hypothetical protein [Vibrio xiamenensis]|uniref:hypothetical protein n=1 Tax=Vibrio xiamenensis TaxID=861298 RepID=UPI000B833054|nr:hypothetical protein [Vibrio xiamenensis]